MPANHAATPWNTERDARLTELHGQTEEPPFSVMAKALNEEFGTVFTRNACISRARRLNLAKRLHKVKSGFEKQAMPRKKPPKSESRQRYSSASNRMVTIFENVEVVRLHCAEIDPLNISLLDLEPGHCRWPYGDREILFCGHGKMDNSNYCPRHFALSRRRMS